MNLELYKPFTENTKAVSLEEESTLKLEDNLPRLDGATALYPLYAAFAQTLYPVGDYDVYDIKKDELQVDQNQGEVVCTNTIGAYTRLMNGETDIIFAARPSEDQLKEAKNRNVELKFTPIGKEAFVFFVNSRNEVNGLSTTQI